MFNKIAHEKTYYWDINFVIPYFIYLFTSSFFRLYYLITLGITDFMCFFFLFNKIYFLLEKLAAYVWNNIEERSIKRKKNKQKKNM